MQSRCLRDGDKMVTKTTAVQSTDKLLSACTAMMQAQDPTLLQHQKLGPCSMVILQLPPGAPGDVPIALTHSGSLGALASWLLVLLHGALDIPDLA